MIMINSGREWDWMDKETKMSKEIIQEVIKILESSNYVDSAEHLYDGLKVIRRNPNNLHDFLWALESPTVFDFDGKVKQCADMIRPLLNQNKDEEVGKSGKVQ